MNHRFSAEQQWFLFEEDVFHLYVLQHQYAIGTTASCLYTNIAMQVILGTSFYYTWIASDLSRIGESNRKVNSKGKQGFTQK